MEAEKETKNEEGSLLKRKRRPKGEEEGPAPAMAVPRRTRCSASLMQRAGIRKDLSSLLSSSGPHGWGRLWFPFHRGRNRSLGSLKDLSSSQGAGKPGLRLTHPCRAIRRHSGSTLLGAPFIHISQPPPLVRAGKVPGRETGRARMKPDGRVEAGKGGRVSLRLMP